MSRIKPNTRQGLKEAEIYVQQGLFREAAGIYESMLAQCRETLKNSGEFDSRKLKQLKAITKALARRLEIIDEKATAAEKPESEVTRVPGDLPAEALIRRAVQLRSLGFYNEAVKEFEKAAEISPEFASVSFEGIAEVLLLKEDIDAGINMLRKALSLVKNDPEKEARLLERIAIIQEQSGNKPEALATYKEILQRHSTYNRIFRKIEELTAQLSKTPLNLGIVCQFPKLFFIAALLFGCFFIAYNPFVKTASDFDFFTLENNPELEYYDTFKTIFGDDEFFIIAFKNDNLFSPETLEIIQQITWSIEELDDVEEVTSLANVNEISGGEDYFEVRPLLDYLPENEAEQSALRDRALQNPLYKGNLISKDGRTTAIVVEPHVDSKDDGLRKRVLTDVKEILAPFEAAGNKFYMAGWTTTNLSLSQYLTSDVLIFVPATYLLITIFTWLFFRNIRITFLSILNISICVGATRGLMGLMGIALNNVTTIIIPLVMALALCDTVHIFSHMDRQILKRFPRRKQALSHVVNRVALPCFLTTLTTAIGFISLCISDIPPVKEFGWIASAGMVFEFIFSFFFLPPLILCFDPKKVYQEYDGGNRISTILRHLFSFVFEKYRLVIVVCAAIVVASVIYTSHLRVETNLMEFFKKSSPVRTALDYVESHLTGVATLDISFQATTLDAFKEPENLAIIEAIQSYTQSLPGIDKAVSFVDFIKDMNQSFHAEKPEFYSIPDSRELIAQYLLLYDADDIEDFINPDFDYARLSIRTARHSSSEKREIIDKIRKFIDGMDHKEIEIRITGRSLKDVLVINALVSSQIYSLALATVIISVLLLIVFRSAALAALSLIPNMFPIILNFGVMGVMGIPLDTGTALIAAVALGIAVDDTIHFLTEYQERRAQGLLIPEALMHVIDTKGRAILSSSLILCVGFGVMVLSRFVPVVHFGLLCAIIMITAVIGDLVLLPAVILLKKEKEAV